ncbi:hypothetical protein NQ318_010579 [Aromia moschata]|uniref:CCHC-type domain-containing protein n=1 Tax=Aromia moschata TaxID=1265417 RepID=A0AAV8X9X0_9CUCU|nr:hypothetical protein NQ318_010579 [Aromia moschata]
MDSLLSIKIVRYYLVVTNIIAKNKAAAKELVKSRKSVREKYSSLKSDIAQSQAKLVSEYKPITEPLEKLLSTVKSDVTGSFKKEPQIKADSPAQKKYEADTYSKYLPMNIPSFLEDTFEHHATVTTNNEEQNTSDSIINQELEKKRSRAFKYTCLWGIFGVFIFPPTFSITITEAPKINTTLKSPGSDIDRLSNPELSSRMEISRIRMKPPQFDGKSSWVNYLRQFEAAAKANGWSLAEKATALTLALRGDATDILQTLSLEEQEDYHQLVRHLEMRYGQSHLEHVYHSQLKNRYQKSNESLQEFEADIARLVRLAYSSTPENVMELLAVQAFLDGLRDTEIRQALILACPSKLVDALARALEFEAAKQSCRGQAKVRRMEEGVEEGICNEAEIRRVVEGMLEKRQIRCWNCGKVGHVRSRCPRNKATSPSSEN